MNKEYNSRPNVHVMKTLMIIKNNDRILDQISQSFWLKFILNFLRIFYESSTFANAVRSEGCNTVTASSLACIMSGLVPNDGFNNFAPGAPQSAMVYFVYSSQM